MGSTSMAWMATHVDDAGSLSAMMHSNPIGRIAPSTIITPEMNKNTLCQRFITMINNELSRLNKFRTANLLFFYNIMKKNHHNDAIC